MKETIRSPEEKKDGKKEDGSKMPLIILGVGIAVTALFIGFKLVRR